MKRRTSAIRALLSGLLLLFPLAAFSAAVTGETVTKHGKVNEDLYAAGGTVDIDAVVIGDIVAAGGELYIGKQVQGDVLVAGGTIRVKGEVYDDIRTAGGDVEIDALIGDGLAAAGGRIRISSGTYTGGDAWLAGGDVYVAGTMGRGVSILAGKIQLAGTIKGDVVLQGAEIEILESAVIEGEILYKSPEKATIHPDAKISGEITHEQVEWEGPLEWEEASRGGYGIVFSLTLITAAIVLYLLFPGFTLSAAGRISSDFWKSLGVGLIVLIVTPVIAFFLMGIVLGIWVGLSLLALYFVVLIVGMLISFFFLGERGARLLNRDVTSTGRRLLSVSLAIILVAFLQLIPVAGGLLVLTLLLMGLGAAVLELHANYSR